jgi:hypothetical protein
MPQPAALLAMAVVLLPLAGCGDAGGGDGMTVRDSAGIEIVENAGSAYGGPPVWTIGEPVLRIGQVEGDAEYLFDGIMGAVRLDDGRIVIANSGGGTVRWYGADGTFLFERGGKGGGPGEFETVSWLGRAQGDTVYAVDSSARRIVRYTTDGELTGTIVVQGLTLPMGRVNVLADGSYVTGVGGYSSSMLGETIVDGVRRDPAPIIRLSADGQRVDTLGMFPGIEIEVRTRERGFSFGTPEFGKALVYAAADDRIYIGAAERMEIGVHAAHGELIRSIRVPEEDLRLTPERLEAYRAWARARGEERGISGPEIEAGLAEVRIPETLPAYGAFLIDSDGNLWVERYDFDYAAPTRWAIFAPDGRLVGPVELPARFQPMHIAGGLVIGRQRDDLDVESLVVYPIDREQQ